MKTTSILSFLICTFFHFSSSQNIDCPSEEIFYLPHSTCTKFIICFDGEVTEMTCPFSLFYNPETYQCDFPENVIECGGGTRPPIRTTTQRPPGRMTECGQSVIADNGTIRYKVGESYDSGELCVFMIRFESGVIESRFTLDTHGFSDTDAVAVFQFKSKLTFEGNLGLFNQYIAFVGYGAMLVFRSNSSLGTGFQISFKRNSIRYPGALPGTTVVFEDEKSSPLNISSPSNSTNETLSNYFVFTSGSELISEPDILFRLSTKGWFQNEEIYCANAFFIYSFVYELKFERSICKDEDEGKLFEFTTRGFFVVLQIQFVGQPIMTGVITWNKVSSFYNEKIK